MVNGVHIPLLIAAGGGGRGYSSQSETPEEVMDRDPSIPGRNGKSGTAGNLDVPLSSFVNKVQIVCVMQSMI